MENFFNAIGVADMEKVHSAIIGWILSDKCKAFDIGKKSNLLCRLFNIRPSRIFKKIVVQVEVYNIDILIETEDCGGKQEVWIIENKVKSNQHSDQLDKYVNIIKGVELTKAKNPICPEYKNISEENQHYCFLTLIKEKPQGKYKNKWDNCLYCQFKRFLEDLLQPKNSHVHSKILDEYLNCINVMTSALSDFLQNHKNYPHVFSDGSKKKVEKKYVEIGKDTGQYASYIAECGLETIFQKCFLSTIIPETKYGKLSYLISDSHGVALVDFRYDKVNNTCLGAQFQNGSFKVQVLEEGCDGMEFHKKWEKIQTDSQTIFNGWSAHRSHENKKPYISFTNKTLNDPQWYRNNKYKIIQTWENAYDECVPMLKKIEDLLKR